MHAHSEGEKRARVLPRLVNAVRAVAGISRFVGSCGLRVLSLLVTIIMFSVVSNITEFTRLLLQPRVDLSHKHPSACGSFLNVTYEDTHDDARVARSDEVDHVQLRKGPGECA